jgi:pimeloyl-ACP methyl ester carboxylesterase
MKIVMSRDGTLIACEQGGRGPHLVLVHGTSANSLRWEAVRPRLEEHFTVTRMDRRGRGGSGDSTEYAIEREFEDVAAVVNSLESPVLLFAHSFGAVCALEAAMRTDKLAGLMLYEAPVCEGESLASPDLLERLENLLATGDREGVLRTFLAEVPRASPNEIEMFASSPAWPGRIAAAHTLPRELRSLDAYRLHEQVGKLSIPVLLLLGGDSPPVFSRANAALEKTLPNSRSVVMPGQKHNAMDTAPDLLVRTVLDFWRDVVLSAADEVIR